MAVPDFRWTTPVGDRLDTRRLGLLARAGRRRPADPSSQPATQALYGGMPPVQGRAPSADPWTAWSRQSPSRIWGMRPDDPDWDPNWPPEGPPEHGDPAPPETGGPTPPSPPPPQGPWYTYTPFEWGGGGGTDWSLSPANIQPFSYKEFEFDPFTGKLRVPEKFDYPEFERPGWEEVLEDPGYQFRLQEGQGALERSAAARGTLRTGGTFKDILNWGQGLASQEYGQVYGRRLGEHEMGFGEALTEYDRDVASALAEYNAQLAGYGANWQTGAGVWDRNFGAARTAYDYDWRRAMQEGAWANTLPLQWAELGLRDMLARYNIYASEEEIRRLLADPYWRDPNRYLEAEG